MSTETIEILNQETKDIIKSTVPVLEEHGVTITTQFYKILFENNPELKNIFNQANQKTGDQPKALANSIYAAALHIDNLEAILPVVKQIGEKHRSLNIKPEHYPIVGENLLIAMKDVLGDAATDEIIDAWGKAYGAIANVFISVEEEMYMDVKNKVGGWVDYRDFKVVKKVVESGVITSFYLEPVDGEVIPTYKPGQYVTVKAKIDGEQYEHLRQYSLSDNPGKDYYRISVKREEAIENLPAGIVSNYLHDHIEEGSILPISAPGGDFVLDQEDERPLVLISGGVGFTPMMSMLETAIVEQPEREIIFIQAARNSQHHAMRKRVEEITAAYTNVKSYVAYDEANPEDRYDKKGYIDETWLRSIIPSNDAAFYFCGPKGFMRAQYQNLKNMDVVDSDIHYEVFGPAEDLSA